MLTLRDWDPAEHPRGQPENAGEFGPGGAAAKAHNTPHPGPNAAKATAKQKEDMSEAGQKRLAEAIRVLGEIRQSNPLPDPRGPVSVSQMSFLSTHYHEPAPVPLQPITGGHITGLTPDQQKLEEAIRVLAAVRSAHPLPGAERTGEMSMAKALGESIDDDTGMYTLNQVYGQGVRNIARSQEWMAASVERMNQFKADAPVTSLVDARSGTLAERVKAILAGA